MEKRPQLNFEIILDSMETERIRKPLMVSLTQTGKVLEKMVANQSKKRPKKDHKRCTEGPGIPATIKHASPQRARNAGDPDHPTDV